MLADSRPSATTIVPRWISVVLAWSAVVGIVGALVTGVSDSGLGGLWAAGASVLPWIVILVLGVIAARMTVSRGTPLALAAVTVATLAVGPAVVSAVFWFDRAVKEDVPREVLFDDATAPYAHELSMIGAALTIIAGILVFAVVVAVLLRLSALPLSQIARTPFRIEVLGALVALFLAAVAQMVAVGANSMALDMNTWFWVDWLSWLVPLMLLLALALRQSGPSSLWVAGALLYAVFVQPVVVALVGGTGLGLRLPESAYLGVPALVLALIVVVWNATPQPPSRSARGVDVAAPLEPWAGAALVLSFLPVLAIPAVVLGHISYERIESGGSPHRGRLIAATAILLAFINLTLVVLFFAGALGSASSLIEGL